jgi:hypothetical protein
MSVGMKPLLQNAGTLDALESEVLEEAFRVTSRYRVIEIRL